MVKCPWSVECVYIRGLCTTSETSEMKTIVQCLLLAFNNFLQLGGNKTMK